MSGSLAVPLRIKLISMDAKVRFPLWTLYLGIPGTGVLDALGSITYVCTLRFL